jgi:hypothetical protein
MSWNFTAKGVPDRVRKQADAYFATPYIGDMNTQERTIALLTHGQIVQATENCPAGYDVKVYAYGSASVCGPNGVDGVLQSARVELGYEKHENV